MPTLDPATLRALAPKCEGINKAGNRCGAIASGGTGRCAFHGGPSKAREAATRARKLFYQRLRPRLTEIELQDQMLQALPYAGRVIMAEAIIAARETRDPMIAIEARRRMEYRYVGRLTAAGWVFGKV